MISLTLFKSSYDVKTNNKITFSKLEDFETWLHKLSRLPLMKPKKDEFIEAHHAPLISPAIYNEGADRCNAEVLYWGGWAALDVDDFQGSIDDIDTGGIYTIVYSTASSKEDAPKFRMVFPLTDIVIHDDIAPFWYALNRRMGDLGDKQVKDLSRMYYIPATYPSAFNFIKIIKGDFINPLQLIRDYPLPKKESKGNLLDLLPIEMKQEYLRSKVEGCNSKIEWTSWKDCPFVNEELVIEYKSIVGTGWYHKLYTIMVSIACNALKNRYMITADQIAELGRDIHLETRGWPTKRKLVKEAERAIEFALENTTWKT